MVTSGARGFAGRPRRRQRLGPGPSGPSRPLERGHGSRRSVPCGQSASPRQRSRRCRCVFRSVCIVSGPPATTRPAVRGSGRRGRASRRKLIPKVRGQRNPPGGPLAVSPAGSCLNPFKKGIPSSRAISLHADHADFSDHPLYLMSANRQGQTLPLRQLAANGRPAAVGRRYQRQG